MQLDTDPHQVSARLDMTDGLAEGALTRPRQKLNNSKTTDGPALYSSRGYGGS